MERFDSGGRWRRTMVNVVVHNVAPMSHDMRETKGMPPVGT
jgi:hypothetical protein